MNAECHRVLRGGQIRVLMNQLHGVVWADSLVRISPWSIGWRRQLHVGLCIVIISRRICAVLKPGGTVPEVHHCGDFSGQSS